VCYERGTKKKSGLQRESKPWPAVLRMDALTTEILGRLVASYETRPALTSSPGPSPRSKWRSEKPLAKAAKVAPKVR